MGIDEEKDDQPQTAGGSTKRNETLPSTQTEGKQTATEGERKAQEGKIPWTDAGNIGNKTSGGLAYGNTLS